MGFNSVAVIYNDCHGQLERDDGRISKLMAQAIRGWSWRDRDSNATWFAAGKIVSQAHADYSQVVVVGQNTGQPLSECNELDSWALAQCADALRRHGWTVKPPAKKRKRLTSPLGKDE